LVGRITNVLSEKEAKRLSPWRIVQSRTSFSEQYGTESTVYKLAGISILDYMDLYMKYMPVKLESYKLDHVAFVELGKRKTENKWDSFREFYKNDFQTFMEYNLNDVALIDDLDRKLRLMELHLMQAYNAKVNFEDVFSQVRTWDALIFNHLKQKNVVVPMMEGHSKDTQYVGAFVKDPQVGMHKWCVSWDCASLYPSCIMSLNISPDTIVEDDERPDDIPTKVTVDDLLNKKIDLSALKKHNLSMAASGQCFRRDKRGFLPEMMQKLFDDRKMAKTKMLDAKKEIEKIDMVLHQRSKESKSE
jgi:DNA polymerase elongation subunit (family B)